MCVYMSVVSMHVCVWCEVMCVSMSVGSVCARCVYVVSIHVCVWCEVMCLHVCGTSEVCLCVCVVCEVGTSTCLVSACI